MRASMCPLAGAALHGPAPALFTSSSLLPEIGFRKSPNSRAQFIALETISRSYGSNLRSALNARFFCGPRPGRARHRPDLTSVLISVPSSTLRLLP
jgi:hypothetical protein